jgi:transposase InsO family protein
MGNKLKNLTKSEIAKKLGVSRSSLYYQHKKPVEDMDVKAQIEAVLTTHPAYGHKRIAWELKLNHKRILRVMKKFNIRPYKRRGKKLFKRADMGKPVSKYENLITNVDPGLLKQNEIWVSDFTYIRYKGRFIYLATIMDLWDREIVGVNISRFHNKELVLGAFENAINKFDKPIILHSDQGTEYDCFEYLTFVTRFGIKVSMSNKASPWQNGYQESFYSNFKLELGDINRFENVGELMEEIYKQIAYYNNQRIHSKLKMSPVQYRKRFEESVSKKRGT